MRHGGRALRDACRCRAGLGIWIAFAALLLLALLVPPLLLPLLLVLTLGSPLAATGLARALAYAPAARACRRPYALRGPPRA